MLNLPKIRQVVNMLWRFNGTFPFWGDNPTPKDGDIGDEIRKQLITASSAVDSCIEIIFNMLMSTANKWQIFDDDFKPPGNQSREHFVKLLLKSPGGDNLSPLQFWSLLLVDYIGKQDAYAIIHKGWHNGKMIPMQLQYVPHDLVSATWENGKQTYRVALSDFHTINETYREYSRDEIIHISGYGFDYWNLRSKSPIQRAFPAQKLTGKAMESIDSGMEVMSGASNFIIWPNMSVEEWKQKVEAEYNNLRSRHKTRHLPFGAEVKFANNLSQDDAISICGYKLGVNEIATIFGVPPKLLGLHLTTGTNDSDKVPTLIKSMLALKIEPALKHIEMEFNEKLLPKGSNYEIKGMLDAKLIITADNLSEVSLMYPHGIATQNENRKMVGLPPIDDPECNMILKTPTGTGPQNEPKDKSHDSS